MYYTIQCTRTHTTYNIRKNIFMLWYLPIKINANVITYINHLPAYLVTCMPCISFTYKIFVLFFHSPNKMPLVLSFNSNSSKNTCNSFFLFCVSLFIAVTFDFSMIQFHLQHTFKRFSLSVCLFIPFLVLLLFFFCKFISFKSLLS